MLPASSSQPWPPLAWKPFQEDIEVDADWYAGNEANLDGRHGETSDTANPTSRAFFRRRKREPGDVRISERRLHVPAAADIAATAADLLFGETPTLTIPGSRGDEAVAEAQATQERLDHLMKVDGWSSKLLEAAEISSALGGVFLRPVIDETLADHPILTIVHPDAAVPVFRHGILAEVTFWSAYVGDKGKVWRHLEQHTPGMIEHALYVGDEKQLGERRHLASHEATINLVTNDADQYGGGIIDLAQAFGIAWVLARYIPNALPNRQHRKAQVGRSDIAGTYGLLNELDETWTSWVRDIRLAKARLIVPDEFLDHNGGRGVGATFDPDREIFSPLSMDPAHMERAGITLVQFQIRNEQHEATAKALFTQIVQTAGYSPQSFGLPGNEVQQTATEVTDRKGRSDATTARKEGYWTRPLEDIAETMLILDAKAFKSGVAPLRPTLDFPRAAESSMRETASTLNLLNLAGVISTETGVRMVNPEWTPDQVKAEVDRIRDEKAPAGDPFVGTV